MKRQVKLAVSFLLLTFALTSAAGCRTDTSPSPGLTSSSDSLTVSAAVSLKDAFTEIAAAYKLKTGRSILFNFGASGALQKQIESGAPVDIFASAGRNQMDGLTAKNLINVSTVKDLARNTLVVILPRDAKQNITEVSQLGSPVFQKIAVGNPKTVPAGQYADQFFEKAGLKHAVEQKLIFAEDVRQVLDYVVRGEVDAGIVYATDARSVGDKVRITEISEETHDAIVYPIGIVKDSKNQGAAREFVDIVLSDEGQGILKKYGFVGAFER